MSVGMLCTDASGLYKTVYTLVTMVCGRGMWEECRFPPMFTSSWVCWPVRKKAYSKEALLAVSVKRQY